VSQAEQRRCWASGEILDDTFRQQSIDLGLQAPPPG